MRLQHTDLSQDGICAPKNLRKCSAPEGEGVGLFKNLLAASFILCASLQKTSVPIWRKECEQCQTGLCYSVRAIKKKFGMTREVSEESPGHDLHTHRTEIKAVGIWKRKTDHQFNLYDSRGRQS